MTAPHLARLQRRFLTLIAQPDPLSAAARALGESDPGAERLCSWLRAASEEEAAARLGIYAHMYFARLHDSLREDFPACARLLGAQAFRELAARYLVRHPSDNPSLRYHGRHFPSFVRECLGAGTPCGLRADLADLCELEWARIEVFDAPEARVSSTKQLARELAHHAELKLRTVPATRILELCHDVDALWSACDGERSPPPPIAHRGALLVWRRGFRVYHRALGPVEAQALKCLCGEGTRFDDLCELFAGEPSVDRAAEHAAKLLAQWTSDALLARAPRPRARSAGRAVTSRA